MAKDYPFAEGDVIVLGPEIFASQDEAVICWRDENYVKQQATQDALEAADRLADAVVFWIPMYEDERTPTQHQWMKLIVAYRTARQSTEQP